ncbi:MAG: ribonuclease P protein component [Chloroflexi bacterium]|nr:ribonuclease P protein component [Chloroflexota bacterium]
MCYRTPARVAWFLGGGSGVSSGSRYGLPRDARLHLQRQYQRMRQEGRTWADRYLVLSAAPNGLPHARLGFVVGKRVGGAVVRNRVRRLMREACRLRRPEIAPGWDVVWIARAGAAEAGWLQIQRSVQGLLQRAGLLLAEAEDEAGG